LDNENDRSSENEVIANKDPYHRKQQQQQQELIGLKAGGGGEIGDSDDELTVNNDDDDDSGDEKAMSDYDNANNGDSDDDNNLLLIMDDVSGEVGMGRGVVVRRHRREDQQQQHFGGGGLAVDLTANMPGPRVSILILNFIFFDCRYRNALDVPLAGYPAGYSGLFFNPVSGRIPDTGFDCRRSGRILETENSRRISAGSALF
jgi:hypothetical protein